MNRPQFFSTPGYGDTQLAATHYGQAVRIGDRVETSGQGGWDDEWTFPGILEDEIVQAFQNVERTLAEAGATWRTGRSRVRARSSTRWPLPVLHRDTPWSGEVYTRGKELERGEWGAAAASEAVLRTVLTTTLSNLAAATVINDR